MDTFASLEEPRGGWKEGKTERREEGWESRREARMSEGRKKEKVRER